MSYVASVVKRLNESPKGMQQQVIENATELVVNGAIVCCTQIGSSAWGRFFSASKDKEGLKDIRQKLNMMYLKIDVEIGCRVLNAIESKGRSPLSKEYPTHAVGIDEPIKEVLRLLECESNQNAVTVILHGFGGMGKSTLADAVFSQVGGCRYAMVRLFKDKNTIPVIEELQKQILADLAPGENIPHFTTYEAGRRELEGLLKKVDAFIYVDNVLEVKELRKLLPLDISTAKKVRILLTARHENVKIACPSSGTEPKIYKMRGIQHPEAMLILKKEIKEGLEDFQLDNIIRVCGGIPLMLTLAAPFLGRASDKNEAYSTLMQDEGKWKKEEFNEMSCAFAYDALPVECKDPFQDICSYFNKWDWDTVENIVGKDELGTLENRALVTRDTSAGVANVHDVILELASHMSKTESNGKDVRLRFTSAIDLKQFLQEQEEEKDPEGTKGIWLSTVSRDELKISAATLDLMHKSLRVLHLECSTNVENNCKKKFEELVYFKAKITQLRFDVSKSKKLRYLYYEPKDLKYLKLYKMPSSLRHLEFDGTSHLQPFEISSTDFREAECLRILRLVRFSKLKKLPEELGDQLKGLRELSLSGCVSIEKLPDSISNLQSLRILKIDCCKSLTELPTHVGSLSSLQKLDLSGCSKLKALPDSVKELSSLTSFNLYGNGCLSDLPAGLGNLTRLVDIDLGWCRALKSIPQSLGGLKLLQNFDVSWCRYLKELPDGLCNLSFVTYLSCCSCANLEKLPDQFGQLASLRKLDLQSCKKLEKLPESFGRLKNLETLYLKGCSNLRELCSDFQCLSSLQNLDLRECKRLEKLPECFNCLTSLQHLHLSSCPNLQAKWMDSIVKMSRLECVDIRKSEQLVKRWAEIQRDDNGSLSFTVISGQSVSDSEKEKIEKKLLSEFDSLLINGQGERVQLSDLPPNTLILVICDGWPLIEKFPWPLIEETVNEMQMQIIFIGRYSEWLPKKVKDSVFVIHVWEVLANEMLEKVRLTIRGEGDGCANEEVYTAHEGTDCWYLQMRTKMVGVKSDKYRPPWSFLKKGELKEFVLSNCRRYLRLKNIAETNQESNQELLKELFASEGNETIPFFEKNDPSEQDRKENSEVKTANGVDQLIGKTILLEMRPADFNYHDIHLQSLKEMYAVVEKEKLPLEIISIPIMQQGKVYDVSGEVPWWVLQNSSMVITSAVKFFLAKQCGWEKEEDDEYEKWYPTILWIIEPNGRITLYRPSLSLQEDTPKMVKVICTYLDRESYQFFRWGLTAFHNKENEELRKEQWEQLKSMSTLEFLFNHLTSVSDQVKKLTGQGKFICLCNQIDEEVLYSMWNGMEQWRERIHIIHTGHKSVLHRLYLTQDICKEYYYPVENKAKIEGMSLLNLCSHEILRFSIRLHHLVKEFNEMDQSDQELCELKSVLLSYFSNERSYLRRRGSMIFMDEGGKVVAPLTESTARIIFRSDRKHRAQRFINSVMKVEAGISENVIRNMEIASDAAVEQENVDAYFNSLREYISELWEVEFRRFLKFNQEGKEWFQGPNVTWPTSTNFCMLKIVLSEGTNADWVNDAVSSDPHKNKRKTVIDRLLDVIEEANWAVAALLAVAHILERFETVAAFFATYFRGHDEKQPLFVLEGMFRLGEYSKQVNQKGELWRRMKRATTAWILTSSIEFCALMDRSKFALFDDLWFVYMLEDTEVEFIEECERMASVITEGVDESGSHLEQMCADIESRLEAMWANGYQGK